jgi:hypothetical protein
MASDISTIKAAVAAVSGEASAVGKVQLALRLNGYNRSPKIQAVQLKGFGTIRVYCWTDTPFGDDLLLTCGAQVQPELKLGSEVDQPSKATGVVFAATVVEPPRSIAAVLAATPREEKRVIAAIPEVAAAVAASEAPVKRGPGRPPNIRAAAPEPAATPARRGRPPRVRESAPMASARSMEPEWAPEPVSVPMVASRGGGGDDKLAAMMAAMQSLL